MSLRALLPRDPDLLRVYSQSHHERLNQTQRDYLRIWATVWEAVQELRDRLPRQGLGLLSAPVWSLAEDALHDLMLEGWKRKEL